MRKGTTNNDVRRIRIKAISLWTSGMGPSDIGKKLGIRRQTVTKWIRIFKSENTRGLLVIKAPRTAKKSKLTEVQIESVILFLNRTLSVERWTYKRVQGLIRETFQVEYSESGVRFLLKQRGYHFTGENRFEKIKHK